MDQRIVVGIIKRLKQSFLKTRVWLRYKNYHPDTVTLPISKASVSINPSDNRAYKKLVLDFVRGRESTPMRFWREHVATLDNPLCLDIGANYGEVMANADYSCAECIAIEANPALITFLNKTRQMHPQGQSIFIQECILGDTAGDLKSFCFSPEWTGGGTARTIDNPNLTVIQQKTDTLDSILAEKPDKRALLMKLDVEGFEARVFSGFSSIKSWQAIIGIMEFGTAMLQQAGTDPKQFFHFLSSNFDVFLSQRRSTHLLSIDSYTDLEFFYSRTDFHCDLVFTTARSLLAPNWSVTPLVHA